MSPPRPMPGGGDVTYTYGNTISKMTGQPTAVTGPTNVTRTSGYNTASIRITGMEIAGTASLDYVYGSGCLTAMTRGGYLPGDTTEQSQTYTMSYDSFGNMTGVSAGKNYTAYLTRQAIETISWRMSREYSIRILPACTLAEKTEAQATERKNDVMQISTFATGYYRCISRGKTIWERRLICEQCENRDLRANSVRRNLPRWRNKERFLHLSSKSYH